MCSLGLSLGAVLALTAAVQAELPEITDLPPDLTVPAVQPGEIAPERRVAQTLPAWAGAPVHHTLYLPENWRADRAWPVLVEYAGNGDYRNAYGDTSDGAVEGSQLGYGLSAGRDYIWMCLPFVEGGLQPGNARLWWGDVEATERYAVAAVRQVCEVYHGDPSRVVLLGFSRGAIAANYIGLRNDEIAGLWCGMLCHSHYDGVRRWPYAESDPASARQRLQRLGVRPQFISHEGDTVAAQRFLAGYGRAGQFTFRDFPFRNHTASWVLRDCELRRDARAWLREVTGNAGGK